MIVCISNLDPLVNEQMCLLKQLTDCFLGLSECRGLHWRASDKDHIPAGRYPVKFQAYRLA